jgi:hypothetical protein
LPDDKCLAHDVIDDFCTSLPKSFHFHEKIDHSWVSALCADDACFLRERTRDDDRNASDHRDYAITSVSKCGGQDVRLPLTINSGHSQKRAFRQRFFFTGIALESLFKCRMAQCGH